MIEKNSVLSYIAAHHRKQGGQSIERKFHSIICANYSHNLSHKIADRSMFDSKSSSLINLSFSLDLDPCDKLQCSFYAKCKAYGPYNASCVCDEDSDIPNYDDQVCSQEKVTYQNSAFLEQESCLKSRKIKVKRPGSCERRFSIKYTRGEIRLSAIHSERVHKGGKTGKAAQAKCAGKFGR